MNIKVNRLTKISDSKIKAFIDLILDGSMIIKGFKIVDGKEGLFVSYPSEKAKDGEFYNTVSILDVETKRQIEEIILKEYNND